VTGFFQQVGFAFKCFFLVLFAGRLPDDLPPRFVRGAAKRQVERDQPPAPPVRAAEPVRPQPTPPIPPDRAVQVLSLLQRDGRLIDFLYEDINAYPDDQVGAAAREVHASCREVLRRYLTVEPVMDAEEGRPTVVDAGFDPAQIKLVGSVAGRPPYKGVIRHRGWRAAKIELPPLADGAGRTVIAPAEVEVE
jgi:hypothetical protein